MKPERKSRTPTANHFTPKNLVIKKDAQLNNTGKRSSAPSKARTPSASSGPALKKQKLSAANKERLSAPSTSSRNRSTSPVSEHMNKLKIKSSRSRSPPKKGKLRLHPLKSETQTPTSGARKNGSLMKKERLVSREKPVVAQKKRIRPAVASTMKSEGKLRLNAAPPPRKTNGVKNRYVFSYYYIFYVYFILTLCSIQ